MWCNSFPIAKGNRQSPIDIQTKTCEVDNQLCSKPFQVNYSTEKNAEVSNTGSSVKVQINEVSGRCSILHPIKNTCKSDDSGKSNYGLLYKLLSSMEGFCFWQSWGEGPWRAPGAWNSSTSTGAPVTTTALSTPLTEEPTPPRWVQVKGHPGDCCFGQSNKNRVLKNYFYLFFPIATFGSLEFQQILQLRRGRGQTRRLGRYWLHGQCKNTANRTLTWNLSTVTTSTLLLYHQEVYRL